MGKDIRKLIGQFDAKYNTEETDPFTASDLQGIVEVSGLTKKDPFTLMDNSLKVGYMTGYETAQKEKLVQKDKISKVQSSLENLADSLHMITYCMDLQKQNKVESLSDPVIQNAIGAVTEHIEIITDFLKNLFKEI